MSTDGLVISSIRAVDDDKRHKGSDSDTLVQWYAFERIPPAVHSLVLQDHEVDHKGKTSGA